MTGILMSFVGCLVSTVLVAAAYPSEEEQKPGDWREALRNPFLKPQIVGDQTCKSLAELESTDFFRLAYSVNGTVLELGRAQKFLVVRCLAQDDSCATSFDSSNYVSRCETKMGVRRALGRRHESDEEYAMWDILLPAACGCSIHRKSEKAVTIQTV